MRFRRSIAKERVKETPMKRLREISFKAYFICSIFLALLYLPYGGVVKAEAKKRKHDEVARTIEQISGIPVWIKVSPSSCPDAYLDLDGSIVLSEAILDSLISEDELAFVISHEVSHKKHKETHCDLPPRLLTEFQSCPQWLEDEITSDIYAIQLMMLAGYDGTASVSVLTRFCPKAVPTTEQRIKAVSDYLAFELEWTSVWNPPHNG